MFHVASEGLNISFSFKHVRDVNATFPLRLNPKKLVEITDITLCDLLVNGTEYGGEACCVKGDRFVKEVGRKVALARALRKAGLSRASRGAVWGRYFQRVK